MARVEKKNMNDSLALRIRRNLPLIEKDVEANDLIAYLISKSVIDFNDKDSLSKAGTRRERASGLVSLLMHRGDRAYDFFLKALRKAQYTHVADRIVGQPFENSGGSVVGAEAAAHEDLVTVSLDDKVSHLEDTVVIQDRRLKRFSERLDKAATKEELKMIQREILNMNAAAEKEKEIKNLKSQLKAKESELASLTEKNCAQVKQLMDEIASLKKQTEKGEKELLQYRNEKAQLETRVQDLIESDLSTKGRLHTVERQAQESMSEINELKSAQQSQKQELVTMFQSMFEELGGSRSRQSSTGTCSPAAENEFQTPNAQRPSQPASDAYIQPVSKTPRAQLPLKESFLQPPEPKIKGPNSQRSQGSSNEAGSLPAEHKVSTAKSPRAPLPIKEHYIQLPEPK
ncbi:unnamed protein product [Lymnaea stagnalis]|uniref:CARD domain-containing protein n=1 Tax=Lymnaea stagnalis TaxID=6523 RepID=A0AAV2H6L7_LYMST